MWKFIAVLVLCLVANQAVADGNHKISPVGGTADKAKELYYKLLEVVGEAITEADDTCNTALEAAKAYAVEAETAAKAEIQTTLDSFQAQLDEINQKAKDAGIDITSCRKYEVQFTQLPDTLMDEITACVNNKISEIQAKIDDMTATATAIQQDFYNIETEIDDCGSGLKAVVCLGKLVIKIGDDTIEGPAKIKKDADDTVVIIQNAWPELKQCAEGSVEKTPAQAEEIVKNFALCAAIP